ncbi:hypothetical protein MKX01_000709, partial [Papaver californicum]
MLLLIIFFLCYHHTSSELITSLPGQLKNVHYFAQANSVNPLSRPLTLWLNGWPGCSYLGF